MIHEERGDSISGRTAILPSLLTLGLVGLFFRFWYFQVATADELIAEAKRSRTTDIKQLAPRGMIVDRRGTLIAGVRREVVVVATPKFALASKKYQAQVAALIGLSTDKLVKQIEREKWRPYVETPIKAEVTLAAATKIEEWGNVDADFRSAFRVDWMPMRYYKNAETLGHVLGYVQSPNAEDVKRIREEGKEPAMFVGKTGVEKSYEAFLMGLPGKETLEVDSKRRPVRSIGVDSPTPGAKLELTIDDELQKFAYDRLGPLTGAVVAIEPSTGEILCLVSKPSYDASLFLGGISAAEYDAITSDPRKPLFNRALQAAYAPGSTFKIVTAIAAQLAGKFSTGTTAFCAGGYFFGGKGRPIKCLGHHGSISFHNAFVKSCNTFFINLGYNIAGKAHLREACKLVGLGEKPGLDIGGDGRGTVPTADFITRYRGEDRMMGGEIANFSIGQGEVSTTPLQMAQVAAFVANRGRSYRPHLVRTVFDPDSGKQPTRIQPELLHKLDAPPQFWDALLGAMEGVVSYGTAARSKVPGVRIGGKTGSAEVRGQHLTNSWFVGIGPMDKPGIVVAILAERAGHGSEAAAPIGTAVIKKYLDIKAGKKPVPPSAQVQLTQN
ncbi:MAG: penicillin-binding protein 2 [Chthonomonas sp.]|nr:penicillin-binding protein 2 [Chthonomonas sp.]